MLRTRFMAGITKYWWLPLLTGLICLGFGIWSICAPGTALPIIAAAFAIGLIIVGVFDGIWGISTSKFNPGWGWDICIAILDIIAGVWMLCMSPENMTLTFLYIVGIWMIFAAFNGIGTMFAVSVYNPLATICAVILLIATLICSFWLLVNPIGLGVTAWVMVGIALCCYGIFKIAFAFKVKSLRERLN